MTDDPKTIAIIVAAGRGARAGEGGPKQYRMLAGEAVLARTARTFLDHPEVGAVRVIIHADDRDLY
ncbi:MAG TPA: 2-C-methyl-D-erythritol 4-phosphate cytidylyltransferase, partial [Parvularculaceae bacterium]|nr:2-C-methyl-D-erythritol 4-phosphate cytidylyltransferase [Parvularculaceae bacterium]